MKVVVTGGAGFVGSHVAEFYANMGNEVIVVDNLSRSALLGKLIGDPMFNVNYLRRYGNIKLLRYDIREREDLEKNVSGVNVIIHAAAQVAVTTSVSDPMTDFEVNALGTFNMLEIARKNDADFVYLSTNKVYGENVNKIPVKEGDKRYSFADVKYASGIPEDFPVDGCGHSPYGCSKLAGDMYCQDYHHTYGLKTGIFRMSCIYGERQFGVEDQGWVAWFTIATLTGRPITIYGDGKQVRDVLHVSDLVNAFNLFLRSNLRHGVYNTGGGPKNTLSLLELLDMLKSMTGISPSVSFSDWRPADQKVYISDISKINRELGWSPKVTPAEGVSRLVKWVRENINIFGQKS
ncbi:MAG: GDP-mannose 4,6-dehydratase [Nitrososphaerota archaeon]